MSIAHSAHGGHRRQHLVRHVCCAARARVESGRGAPAARIPGRGPRPSSIAACPQGSCRRAARATRNRPSPACWSATRSTASTLHPDLVIIAEGLNDMRSGMPLAGLRRGHRDRSSRDIGRQTGALVVLVGIYHQAFGKGANDPAVYPTWTRWTQDDRDCLQPGHPLTAERLGAHLRGRAADHGWRRLAAAYRLVPPQRPGPRAHRQRRVRGHRHATTRRWRPRRSATIEERDVSILNTGGTDTDEDDPRAVGQPRSSASDEHVD